MRAHRELARIQDRAQKAGQKLPTFDIESDLQSFCEWGSVDFTHDYEAATEQVLTQAKTLAKRLTALGPRAGVARFGELAEQAQVVGEYTGHLTAIRMGELMTDPAAWYEAAAESGDALLLGSALTRWLAEAPDTVPPSVLLAALDDAASRPTVISAVLARSLVDQTGELVIDSMRAEDAALLETLIRHEPDDVMHRLLIHRPCHRRERSDQFLGWSTTRPSPASRMAGIMAQRDAEPAHRTPALAQSVASGKSPRVPRGA
jgi:hypothetical protein